MLGTPVSSDNELHNDFQSTRIVEVQLGEDFILCSRGWDSYHCFLFGVRFMAGQFGAYDSCNLKSAFLRGVGAVQAELLIMLHKPFKLHKFIGALENLSVL